ncbi:MAG: YigZ family protein [Campylobacter sp.]|nr:YigZ family protein [Campylobacter sp.]
MQQITQIFEISNEVKKSKFIAFLTPFSEFDALLSHLKNEHPKAAHIVWAYRVLNEFNQIVENQSDDGEPKGTSGTPCLNALRGVELINTAVLVVRYFGGIKLGTGGLVRAYASSVNLAINSATLTPFEFKKSCEFFVPFSLISKFEHFFSKQNLKFNAEFNADGANFKGEITKNEFENLNKFIQNLQNESVKFGEIPKFS